MSLEEELHADGRDFETRLPTYCNFHKFLLVEEIILEDDYRQLHCGKCRVIGRVQKTSTFDFFLENVPISNLPEEYSLPEGTIKLYLQTLPNAHPTLEHDFKNAFEQILPIQEEEAEEQEENTYSTTDYAQLSEELDQLKLMGLPTSFGGRPQNSSKKSKKPNKNLHFSNFFSESDIENASSESEMEENSSPSSDTINLHGIDNKVIAKTPKSKKKNRKLKNVPSFILEEKGLLKYWRKRFSLFSRFDEGIRLDRESWFSVTPEKVAKHLADRLKTTIMVDGFCGSGGNAIQFALTCEKVIAIDIDPVKLEMAKHNAKIYNVSHKIEFILGDFLQLASGGKLKADVVFLSPPWGGPKYKNKKDYDIEKFLLPVKASELVDVARLVSDNVALFLPRNSNIKQIIRLAGPGKRCEIEHSYLDSRLVAITALYGDDILQKQTSSIN
ncbi:uncharacterized protein LOC142220169 isoform X2 [Haematobia irritans]|uniref:uncharacterized protein LOC142220169 isoform X2 n=1 Tax=Haematobia irritans TaxID=7368 RepID=UPI003F4FBCF7